MTKIETGYGREAIKQELQDLEQKIARLEARTRQPDEDEHLKQLLDRYEQLQSQLEDRAA